MTIVCPITNTDKNNPLHVELKGLKTTGFVLCDQIRAIDIRARSYKVVETIDEDTLWEICDIAQGSIGIEPKQEKSETTEANAMIALNSIGSEAAERGFLSDEEIDAEIKAYRQEKLDKK